MEWKSKQVGNWVWHLCILLVYALVIVTLPNFEGLPKDIIILPCFLYFLFFIAAWMFSQYPKFPEPGAVLMAHIWGVVLCSIMISVGAVLIYGIRGIVQLIIWISRSGGWKFVLPMIGISLIIWLINHIIARRKMVKELALKAKIAPYEEQIEDLKQLLKASREKVVEWESFFNNHQAHDSKNNFELGQKAAKAIALIESTKSIPKAARGGIGQAKILMVQMLEQLISDEKSRKAELFDALQSTKSESQAKAS